MLDGHARSAETLSSLGHDPLQFGVGHCGVGCVLDPGYVAAVVRVPHRAQEKGRRAAGRRSHFGQKSCAVYRVFDNRGAHVSLRPPGG